MINSTAAPIPRSNGRRELFLRGGADSGARGFCGPAEACPKVSDAGRANMRVYSPGPCAGGCDGAAFGPMFGEIFGGTYEGVAGTAAGVRGVANTCVAFPEGACGCGIRAVCGGGGGEGMSPRPKICVNSPAPLGCDGGGGVNGTCGDPPSAGVIGDWKYAKSSTEDGRFAGVAGVAGRCACSIWVNSPGCDAGAGEGPGAFGDGAGTGRWGA
jgi:hypothetical protein